MPCTQELAIYPPELVDAVEEQLLVQRLDRSVFGTSHTSGGGPGGPYLPGQQSQAAVSAPRLVGAGQPVSLSQLFAAVEDSKGAGGASGTASSSVPLTESQAALLRSALEMRRAARERERKAGAAGGKLRLQAAGGGRGGARGNGESRSRSPSGGAVVATRWGGWAPRPDGGGPVAAVSIPASSALQGSPHRHTTTSSAARGRTGRPPAWHVAQYSAQPDHPHYPPPAGGGPPPSSPPRRQAFAVDVDDFVGAAEAAEGRGEVEPWIPPGPNPHHRNLSPTSGGRSRSRSPRSSPSPTRCVIRYRAYHTTTNLMLTPLHGVLIERK